MRTIVIITLTSLQVIINIAYNTIDYVVPVWAYSSL